MNWQKVKRGRLPICPELLIYDDREVMSVQDTHDVSLGMGSEKRTVSFYQYWKGCGANSVITHYMIIEPPDDDQ